MTKASLILSTFIATVSITAEANQLNGTLESIYTTASNNEQLQTRVKNESATLALKSSKAMALGLKSLMHTDDINDRLARPEYYIDNAKVQYLSIRRNDLKQVLASIDGLLQSDDCVQSKCKSLVLYYEQKNTELKDIEKQIDLLNKSLRGE